MFGQVVSIPSSVTSTRFLKGPERSGSPSESQLEIACTRAGLIDLKLLRGSRVRSGCAQISQ